MSLISVNKLTFSYDTSYDNIFENASFQIDTDWKLGLIGRNGKGKTTLLHLLKGDFKYKGEILSTVKFDLFPFIIKNSSADTHIVVEEIYPEYEYWQLTREINLMELSDETLYRPFNTLSFGEQTKIMLATLFLKENNFLLIDEPTNHLDMDGRLTVSNYLKKKKGFILVSHDRKFLDNCIDHVLSINRSNIDVQKGNFSSWEQNKNYQDQYELGENTKLTKEIDRLKKAAKKTEQWSFAVEKSKFGNHAADRGFIGHKSAKMMKRSKNTLKRYEKSIEEKNKLLKNLEIVENLKIHPIKHHTNPVVNCDNVCIMYGDKSVFNDVTFSINTGDRACICGKNGCGKSTLLKFILGDDISYTGIFNKASNIIISYVSQDISYLKGSLKEHAVKNNIDESLFKAILNKLDFKTLQFEKNMSDYSAGQKKKVLIASSLCQKAHLYIWDEPLNFIDIYSRLQIQQLLIKYSPTMIFVEHDATFVEETATKKIFLSN